MITSFRLENFKGHRDTRLALQQLTVLVGDNGSGKTSVLEALQLPEEVCTYGETPRFRELVRQGTSRMDLSSEGRTQGHSWTTTMEVMAPDDPSVATPEQEAWLLRVAGADGSGTFDNNDRVAAGSRMPAQLPLMKTLRRVCELTRHVGLYRFRSDQVAASAYSEQAGAFVAEDGAQTAVALAALKLADDEAFNQIENAMRKIVPSLRRVRIRPIELMHPSNPNPVVGSKLYFDFQGAKNVPAHHASQGTLVLLALLTVLYSRNRPGVILLDDFDHSLHPRAQMELVRMIKELLALDELHETQLILTTHSPYVLDEVSPSDVIAFALRDDGTVAAKPLSEHPDAPKVNGALKAGELWSLDAERDWVR